MTEKCIFGSIGKLRPHMTELTHFLGVLMHALDFWKKMSGVLIIEGREGHIAACILYDAGAFAPALWQHFQYMIFPTSKTQCFEVLGATLHPSIFL